LPFSFVFLAAADAAAMMAAWGGFGVGGVASVVVVVDALPLLVCFFCGARAVIGRGVGSS
jgi:hypothetical protein